MQMVGDIETGNNVTEVSIVKGKKEGTQDRTLGVHHSGIKRYNQIFNNTARVLSPLSNDSP